MVVIFNPKVRAFDKETKGIVDFLDATFLAILLYFLLADMPHGNSYSSLI